MDWFDSAAFKMTLLGLSAALIINTCGRKVANFAWVWIYTYWNERRPEGSKKTVYKWVCTGKVQGLGCPSTFLFRQEAHDELRKRKNVKCPRCRHDILFVTGTDDALLEVDPNSDPNFTPKENNTEENDTEENDTEETIASKQQHHVTFKF